MLNKILISFLISFSLIGCTGGKDNSPNQTEDGFSVDISKITLDIGGQALPEELDLGIASDNKELSHKITIKNGSPLSMNLAVALSSDEGFKIKLNRCSLSLAAGKSCDVTVSFSSRYLFDGSNYTAVLDLTEDSQLLIKAQVSGKPDPESSGSPELEISLDSPFVPANGSAFRTLTIVNVGNGTAKNLQAQIPASYQLRLNRCPSELKPGKSCFYQVTYKNFRSNTPPPEEEEISVSGTNVTEQPKINLSNGTPVTGVIYVSHFIPPSDPGLLACQGPMSIPHTPVCYEGSIGGTVVDNSNCSFDTTPSTVFQSPAGQVPRSIPNGSEIYSCALGSSDEVFVSRSCSSGYVDSGTACQLAPQTLVDWTTGSSTDCGTSFPNSIIDPSQSHPKAIFELAYYGEEKISEIAIDFTVMKYTGSYPQTITLNVYSTVPPSKTEILNGTAPPVNYLGPIAASANAVISAEGSSRVVFDFSSSNLYLGGKFFLGLTKVGGDIVVGYPSLCRPSISTYRVNMSASGTINAHSASIIAAPSLLVKGN